VIAVLEGPGGARFEADSADLLAEKTDAIVNAANGHLAHGGGVAAAIAAAAGPELEREGDAWVGAHGPIPTGRAVATTAGRLPFRAVIHAVGPMQGEGDEERLLADALRSAFAIAHERGYRSLSFPAVSSGIFAVPADVCARAYVQAVRSFWAAHPVTPLKSLRLCLFRGPIVEAVKRAMQAP
jgi:O-acetyl-ADP-ribose deacetylase (regulator of RNase III)